MSKLSLMVYDHKLQCLVKRLLCKDTKCFMLCILRKMICTEPWQDPNAGVFLERFCIIIISVELCTLNLMPLTCSEPQESLERNRYLFQLSMWGDWTFAPLVFLVCFVFVFKYVSISLLHNKITSVYQVVLANLIPLDKKLWHCTSVKCCIVSMPFIHWNTNRAFHVRNWNKQKASCSYLLCCCWVYF